MPRNKRRGWGDGSIYQRADGRWVGSIELGKDANGKRRRRVVYGKTRAEVREKLLDAQTRKGEFVAATPEKVGEFLERWLDTVVRQDQSEATWKRYTSVVTNHIAPRLGHAAVSEVTSFAVEATWRQMLREGVSESTCSLCHAILSSAMKAAVRWRLIEANPCANVAKPKYKKEPAQPFARDEIERVIESAGQHGPMIRFALMTAVRRGELLGLQWSDIDAEYTKVEIRRQQTPEGVLVVPKRDSYREIHLPEAAVAALHGQRKRLMRLGLAKATPVFPAEDGTYMRTHSFNEKIWIPAIKKASVPHRGFHAVRHTAATLMLQSGVNIKVVQQIMGHSSISTTLDTYGHVMPDGRAEAARQFSVFLDN